MKIILFYCDIIEAPTPVSRISIGELNFLIVGIGEIEDEEIVRLHYYKWADPVTVAQLQGIEIVDGRVTDYTEGLDYVSSDDYSTQ